MATTSFSESLKYGGRLFGFFLGAVLAGGGLLALGAYLAVPEIQTALGSETVETASLAGGLVLATLGIATLIIATFALTYKLIADAVARGSEQSSAVADPTTNKHKTASNTEQNAELGPSPGEQTALEHGPNQTVPDGTSGSGADGATRKQPREQKQPGGRSQEQFDRPPEQEGSAATATGRPQEQSGAKATEPPERAAPSEASEPLEQTAEEIAFDTERPAENAGKNPEAANEQASDDPDRGEIETEGDTSTDPLANRSKDTSEPNQ